MISAIINFVATLTGGIFHLVGMILHFVFALPLWLIVAQNLLGLLAVVAIISLLTRKKARK